MKITFAHENAHSAFHSMCEGMSEVQRDDENDSYASQLDSLIEFTHIPHKETTYPVSFTIPAELHDAARNVIENIQDNDGEEFNGIAIEQDTSAKPFWSAAVKMRGVEMDTRDALETALEVLTLRAQETDTASPEGHVTRLAMEQIERMLAQRGCEHFDKAGNGTLTDLCDIIIFG